MTAAPNLLGNRDYSMEGVFFYELHCLMYCLNPMCVQMGFLFACVAWFLMGCGLVPLYSLGIGDL